jgi:hypothetical protein
MFEKYVLTFERVHTMTAEGLASRFTYSPEIGDDTASEPEEHIDRCVYNPNLQILPYLDGKINKDDKITLRRIIEFTRNRYFVKYDVNYASYEFPVVTDHCGLPISTEAEEEVVLKYITTINGFKNIKKVPYVESEWEKKKLKYLPEVEKLYSGWLTK